MSKETDYKKEREKRVKEHRRRSNADILATYKGKKTTRSSSNYTTTTNAPATSNDTSTSGSGQSGQRGEFTVRTIGTGAIRTATVIRFPTERVAERVNWRITDNPVQSDPEPEDTEDGT